MSEGNREQRIVALARWLVLAFIPATAIVMLLGTGQGGVADPTLSLEPLLIEVGRTIALALACWILATQVTYTLAVLTRTTWLADTLRPVTLPILRRAATGLASMAITFSAATALAQVRGEAPVVVVTPVGMSQEATPTPVLEPIATTLTQEPCLTIEEELGSYAAPLVWLVRPGDNLWKIAAEHLTIVLDRAPTRDEHRSYWVLLKDTARPVIRSGDADLIYPSERIPLPPTLDAGVRR